jgi:exodeoxyribonuclease V alpha subunit
MDEPKELRGTVTRLFFCNPNGQFCAGRLLPEADDVTRRAEVSFAGKIFVNVGEAVTLSGKWVDSEKYGRQFQATSRVHEGELSVKGLAGWLAAHGDAHGIGPVKAKKIAAEFGENFGGVLADNPEQIAIACRVPLDSVKRLAEAWEKRREFNVVGTQLMGYGLTQAQASALYKKYHGSIVPMLQADPYMLVGEIDGFGFRRVDEIAQKIGVGKRHPGRLKAAIIHSLKEQERNGATCVSFLPLIDAAVEAIQDDAEDAELDVSRRLTEIEEEKSVFSLKAGEEYFSLPNNWRHEKYLYEFLRDGNYANPHWPDADGAAAMVDRYCPTLDESQRSAIALALRHRGVVISGGAGSGKTTLIKSLYKLYAAGDNNVALCAPTGKAARRMEQVVAGSKAYTIHRLLEYMPKLGGFQRNENNPIEADVVVVDEVSMMDSSLAYHLFRAVGPRTAVVLVGDHNQLPPVGAGALLRDCKDREILPKAILTHCHRQAGPLKRNCAAILQGKVADTEPAQEDGGPSPWIIHQQLPQSPDVLACVRRLYESVLPKWGYSPTEDVQFITPQHKGPLGTRSLNILLQQLHQRSLKVNVPEVAPDARPPLYVGDRVIHTRNNYALDVMNGHQGTIVETSPYLQVDYDGRTVVYGPDDKGDVELGYVLTAHKCQGSEYPCVVVICHKAHSFCLHRNWLYTASTRAQKTCVIIGDKQGITGAASKTKANDRLTLLSLLAGNRTNGVVAD